MNCLLFVMINKFVSVAVMVASADISLRRNPVAFVWAFGIRVFRHGRISDIKILLTTIDRIQSCIKQIRLVCFEEFFSFFAVSSFLHIIN